MDTLKTSSANTINMDDFKDVESKQGALSATHPILISSEQNVKLVQIEAFLDDKLKLA